MPRQRPAGFLDGEGDASRFWPACDYPSSEKMVLSVHGIDFWVETEGTGQPLLLLHGGPGVDHRSLHPGLSILASHCRLIYFDLRGHYMSGEPPSNSEYGLSFDADDAEAIRAELGLGPLHVLGHSYGAIVALELARRHPASVRSVMACSCPVGLSDVEVEKRLGTDSASIAVDVAVSEEQRLANYLSFYHHRPVDRTTRAYAVLVEESFRTAKNRRMLESREEAGAADIDWLPLLDQVRCPVLFLGGEHDPLVDGLLLRQHCSNRSHMRSTVIPEARHEIFTDQPWVFRREVLRFVGDADE